MFQYWLLYYQPEKEYYVIRLDTHLIYNCNPLMNLNRFMQDKD